MPAKKHVFVIMPFGRKKLADGTQVDFDAIFDGLLEPAITGAGLTAFRADAELGAGSIHSDMFQELLLADMVVADLTQDNPNVWYEVGVRDALRRGGSIMTYSSREKAPFDIVGQRTHRYSLVDGRLDPAKLDKECAALAAMIRETMRVGPARVVSSVYQYLPSLREPDWKSLRLRDTSKYWSTLERWQDVIDVARRKDRPGDILVLADEAPNSVLEIEALRKAAKALLKLQRPFYALKVVEQGLDIDPDDLALRQLEGLALGRTGDFLQAQQKLGRLWETCKDGETGGLYARTFKDEWVRSWKEHPLYGEAPETAAQDTSEMLKIAAQTYYEAFRAAPADTFPGINALTLGRLWEHLNQTPSGMPLDLVASAIDWGLSVQAKPDYWSKITKAELFLVEGRGDAAREYRTAFGQKPDPFDVESSWQQLMLLKQAGFRPEAVSGALAVLEKNLGKKDEPTQVVVFSGHMIDNPDVRGPGKKRPARFPAEKIDAVYEALRARLAKIGASAGDLGVCGGASGGDLLFAKACLELKMRVEVRLAKEEPEFLGESVTFADPDHMWENLFMEVRDNPLSKTFLMPKELGETPDGVSVHDRCNRWIMYSALARGLKKVSFVTLWNGEAGDGPGGTSHMVELVQRLTGRKPEIIDPVKLKPVRVP